MAPNFLYFSFVAFFGVQQTFWGPPLILPGPHLGPLWPGALSKNDGLNPLSPALGRCLHYGAYVIVNCPCRLMSASHWSVVGVLPFSQIHCCIIVGFNFARLWDKTNLICLYLGADPVCAARADSRASFRTETIDDRKKIFSATPEECSVIVIPA